MSPNGNGKGNGWVVRSLVAVLFTIAFGFTGGLTAHVIGNDEKSRTRDDKLRAEARVIERDVRDALQDIKTEQNIQFTKIAVALAEIKTKANN